jgi:DNA-binding response OmpR family regulator
MTKTLLLIHEDADWVSSLKVALSGHDEFKVFDIPNGILGLAYACATPPDCIVVDVEIADLNGFQMIQALRGDPKTAHIPLILVGNRLDKGHFKALAVGVDCYIDKPIQADRLIISVQQAISRTYIDRITQLTALSEHSFIWG